MADTYSGVLLTYQTDGSLIRRVKLPLAAEPVSAAHIAAWKEPQLEPLRRSGDSDRLIQTTRMLDQISFPEHLPVLRRLFVSQDGRVWLEEYPGPEATRRYLVLDTAGRIVARAESPERALVQDARGDRMLVRWRDSLDRDFVRVHRMTAGRQP